MECSCMSLSGWIFISDNTSHSNNHVNHYLQQIHEHYDAYYLQHDFGHITVLTVWADNCSEQFKSCYQLGWSVLYVNNTRSNSSIFLLPPTWQRASWWVRWELQECNKSRREVSKGSPLCYWCVPLAAKQFHCSAFARYWAFFCEETNISFCPNWTGAKG